MTLDHQLVHSSQSLSAEPHDFASVDQPTNVAEPAPTVMGNEVNPVVNTSGDEAENSELVGSLITENQPCTSEEVGSSLPIVDC